MRSQLQLRINTFQMVSLLEPFHLELQPLELMVMMLWQFYMRLKKLENISLKKESLISCNLWLTELEIIPLLITINSIVMKMSLMNGKIKTIPSKGLLIFWKVLIALRCQINLKKDRIHMRSSLMPFTNVKNTSTHPSYLFSMMFTINYLYIFNSNGKN
jgi:hypothetical protein